MDGWPFISYCSVLRVRIPHSFSNWKPHIHWRAREKFFKNQVFYAVFYRGTMLRLVQIETWFFGIIHCIWTMAHKISSDRYGKEKQMKERRFVSKSCRWKGGCVSGLILQFKTQCEDTANVCKSMELMWGSWQKEPPSWRPTQITGRMQDTAQATAEGHCMVYHEPYYNL